MRPIDLVQVTLTDRGAFPRLDAAQRVARAVDPPGTREGGGPGTRQVLPKFGLTDSH